jgi:hypothetical protein
MVSISLIALTEVTRAQENLSLYEMSFAPLAVSVKGDSGGNIAQYVLRTEEYRVAQTQVSLPAAAIRLHALSEFGAEQICIRRLFPIPCSNREVPTGPTDGQAVLLERYPDWVKDWISLRGGRTPPQTMDYAYARQFVQPCRTRIAIDTSVFPKF